jgi:hypothetical protein
MAATPIRGWLLHREVINGNGKEGWRWRWFAPGGSNPAALSIYATHNDAKRRKAAPPLSTGTTQASRRLRSPEMAVPTDFTVIAIDLATELLVEEHTIAVPSAECDAALRLKRIALIAELARAMSAGYENGGIKVRNRMYQLKLYKKTFVLRDAGAWLMDRVGDDAISVGTMMLNLGLFAHCCCEHAFDLEAEAKVYIILFFIKLCD